MIGRVYEHEDLQRMSQYTRQADVEAWLKRCGIRYGTRRGGFWTTEDALNRALGVTQPEGDSSYDPNSVL